ncbi:MAG: hypothetical protein AAGG48_27750 [Planctomycetota bacterium]
MLCYKRRATAIEAEAISHAKIEQLAILGGTDLIVSGEKRTRIANSGSDGINAIT